MFSSYAITNRLLTQIVFFTAKSRRQTTPNLIKNPILTKRGIFKPPIKSYAYQIPQNIPNSHLYWNNTIQNRLRRKQYNAHRLYKLGIRAIHDEKGNPLLNRSRQQILYQLSNLNLLKQSLGRTLINLRQLYYHHKDVMLTQDKDIIYWAINQLQSRNIHTMNRYEFSTYCFLREVLNYPPTQKLIVHLYKWIQSQVEMPTQKFKPKFLLSNMRYIFNQSYSEELNEILYKKQINFKLFEDLEPMNKPLEELLPRLFSDEELKGIKKEETFSMDHYKFLIKIPGGKTLYDRIQRLCQ